MLLVARIFAATSRGANGVNTSLIADYYPTRLRGTAYSIYTSANLWGAGLAAVFAGYAGQHWGWRVAFGVAAIPWRRARPALAAAGQPSARPPRGAGSRRVELARRCAGSGLSAQLACCSTSGRSSGCAPVRRWRSQPSQWPRRRLAFYFQRSLQRESPLPRRHHRRRDPVHDGRSAHRGRIRAAAARAKARRHRSRADGALYGAALSAMSSSRQPRHRRGGCVPHPRGGARRARRGAADHAARVTRPGERAYSGLSACSRSASSASARSRCRSALRSAITRGSAMRSSPRRRSSSSLACASWSRAARRSTTWTVRRRSHWPSSKRGAGASGERMSAFSTFATSTSRYGGVQVLFGVDFTSRRRDRRPARHERRRQVHAAPHDQRPDGAARRHGATRRGGRDATPTQRRSRTAASSACRAASGIFPR